MLTKSDRRRVPLSLIAYRIILLMTVAVSLIPEVVKWKSDSSKHETCVEDLTAPPSSIKRIPQFGSLDPLGVDPIEHVTESDVFAADAVFAEIRQDFDKLLNFGSNQKTGFITSNSVLPPKWGGL